MTKLDVAGRIISLDQDKRDCFNGHVEEFNKQIVTFEKTSNYSVEEIEELYAKIEEERQNINHILEIKELLVNSENETETEIIISLRRLTLIVVSSEDLMVTNIRTAVSGLQLHWSKKVIREAKKVVKKFKRIIEEGIDENADRSTRTISQDPPTILDEHVLFIPPMDEGILISYIPNLDFTTFFDDIDDDGNPIIHESPSTENNTELTGAESISIIRKQKQELIEKLISPRNHTTPHKKTEMINGGHIYPPIIERKLELLRNENSLPIPTRKRQKHSRRESRWNNRMCYNRPSDTQLSLQRFAKHREQKDSNNDNKTVKKDERKVHLRSNAGLRQSRGTSDDAPKMDEKLETSKRKLVHHGYQSLEKDRKGTRYYEGNQHEIPKDEYSRRNSRPRYSNRSRR